jgi:hypothetical protein
MIKLCVGCQGRYDQEWGWPACLNRSWLGGQTKNKIKPNQIFEEAGGQTKNKIKPNQILFNTIV